MSAESIAAIVDDIPGLKERLRGAGDRRKFGLLVAKIAVWHTDGAADFHKKEDARIKTVAHASSPTASDDRSFMRPRVAERSLRRCQ